MKTDRRFDPGLIPALVAVGVLAGFVSPATAADVSALCSGSGNLSNGIWAKFATDAPFMQEKVEGRYAVVGEEGGLYWLEYEVGMPMGGGAAVVMKVLVPNWPYTDDAVKRAMMQLPGMESMAPMEVPPDSVQKDNLSDPLQMACDEADEGTRESVTVPAGTFSALRVPVRKLGKDVWLSTEVPFGIVKMVDDGGKGLEIIAFGNDAEAAITEAPRKVPGVEY